MRVLVCGGRRYSDKSRLFAALDALPVKPTVIIHGGACGADTLAGTWARCRGIYEVRVPADWSLGKVAGHLRNQKMLDEQAPDYCVAFPGGRGTDDMVKRCKRAGLPVWAPYGLTKG